MTARMRPSMAELDPRGRRAALLRSPVKIAARPD
jgi:hypothetical protein